MPKDIVTRLRSHVGRAIDNEEEAADEIERLRSHAGRALDNAAVQRIVTTISWAAFVEEYNNVADETSAEVERLRGIGGDEVKDIIVSYLRCHGFDGLYGDECGCELDDLVPCGESPARCSPGVKRPCPENCGDHDWHIVPKEEDGAADSEFLAWLADASETDQPEEKDPS